MSPATSSKVSSIVHKAFSLHQQGKIDKAEKHYRKALKLEPRNFDALQGLGAVALHKKQYKTAIKFFESAVAINPTEPGLLTNLGLALKHVSDKVQARQNFEKSIKLDNSFGPAFYNLALLDIEEGNFEQALEALYQSEQCRPGHIPTLTSIAYTSLRLGLIGDAINYFRHAIQLNPDDASLHFELGKAYQLTRQDQEAVSELRKAINLDPGLLDAGAKLADVLESLNNLDDALSEAAKVLSSDNKHPLANLVKAKIERRQGDLDSAKNRLLGITHEINNDVSAAIFTELGVIHDRLSDYDNAFKAFSKANKVTANLPAAKSIDPQKAYQLIDSCKLWIKNQSDNKTGRAAKTERIDDFSSPIFLVGFPRSGTTLTEQILAAHEDIVTSDELPVLHNIAINISQILDRDIEYPHCLDNLTDEDIYLLREYYWKHMTGDDARINSSHMFIDKMPLNIIHMGLIDRIFPHSKVIIALRDPRDVCLSCFMQLFQVNESMLQFLDITSTAKYYAAVMGLWLQYKELLETNQLQLDWIESRYEDIVSDIDQHSGRLFTFLGIDKNRVSGNFYQQAAKRSISTPSYQDVSTPVYKRAVGRWRHYEHHLAPVRDDLTPFVRAFDYQD